MIAVEKPPKYLCRVTRPDLLKIDKSGYLLPHRENTMDVYGQTVPLVHPSELGKVIDFFYNNFWLPELSSQFLLLIFQGDKLQNLTRHEALGVLTNYGEHFALANVTALKEALVCRVIGQRNPENRNAHFRYKYSGEKHPITPLQPNIDLLSWLFLNALS